MAATVRFGIIGTGFAGTCALWHLVRRLTDPARPRTTARPRVGIVTVERGPLNGPGFPYAPGNVRLAHRCNNAANTMGIHGDDFVDWMSENRSRLVRDHPRMVRETHPGVDLDTWRPVGDEFYPRALFGLYLAERFGQAVDRARAHGIEVQRYLRAEVVDGVVRDGRFCATLRGVDTGLEVTLEGFDRVLLATGHQLPTGAAAGGDGRVATPYPPDAMTAVVERHPGGHARRAAPRVFVQGMGPTGIDAILSLCDPDGFAYGPDGHATSYRPGPRAPRIVAGSRCGFFSPVRGPLADVEPVHLTEERLDAVGRDRHGRLRIAAVLDLLDRDLRRATGGTRGWCDVASPRFGSAAEKLADDLERARTGDVVHTLVLKARRMGFYRRLAPADKRHYDELLDSHFIRTAVPMPAANARKLLALVDAGVLTTVRLGYDGPDVAARDDGTFTVTHLDRHGTPARFTADCVVRAVTPDAAPAPLMRTLLRRGEVVPHQEEGYVPGGIAVDPRRGYRVLRRAAGGPVPSPHLAAFGAPVRFWQNEHNFAGAFVEAAERVAEDWLEVVDDGRGHDREVRERMEMKEFYYRDGLRVSVFNLDHEFIPFHFHNRVSDMMFCARGRIRIELPETGRVLEMGPGGVFQVPSPVRHRFVNGAPVGTASRYVLLQIGAFDITFLDDDAAQPPDGVHAELEEDVVYVEDRREDILALADRFEADRPEDLTAEEQADVVTALRSLASRGRAAAHPLACAGA